MCFWRCEAAQLDVIHHDSRLIIEVELRIHHIFDIIRDIGRNKILEKHEYGHSYHIIAKKILNNEFEIIKIVVKSDDVCRGCVKLYDGKCIDIIDHRKDFLKKEEFNNYLDNRIMKVLNINNDDIFTFKDIFQLTKEYLKNIEYIYEGNDIIHTQERKKNVEKGLLKLKN